MEHSDDGVAPSNWTRFASATETPGEFSRPPQRHFAQEAAALLRTAHADSSRPASEEEDTRTAIHGRRVVRLLLRRTGEEGRGRLGDGPVEAHRAQIPQSRVCEAVSRGRGDQGGKEAKTAPSARGAQCREDSGGDAQMGSGKGRKDPSPVPPSL